MRLVILLTIAAIAFLTVPAAADGNFSFRVSFGSGWYRSAPAAYAPVVYAPVAYAPVAYAPVVYAPVVCAPVVYAPVVYAPVVYAPVVYAPVACAPVAYVPTACAPVVYAPAPVIVHGGGWNVRRQNRWVRHDDHAHVVAAQPVIVQQPYACSQPVVVVPAAPVVQCGVPVQGQFVRASYGWRR